MSFPIRKRTLECPPILMVGQMPLQRPVSSCFHESFVSLLVHLSLKVFFYLLHLPKIAEKNIHNFES